MAEILKDLLEQRSFKHLFTLLAVEEGLGELKGSDRAGGRRRRWICHLRALGCRGTSTVRHERSYRRNDARVDCQELKLLFSELLS
jgi:hypothetical protein